MKTAIMKLSNIRPAEYNPRITLKPGDTEYEALKNSLERFGLATPLVVNGTTGTLISGHQRLNVMKAEGVTEAEVVIVEMDEEQEKLLNIAMNKIDGDWDYDKLEELFADFADDDFKYTGFSEDELDRLFDITEDVESDYTGEAEDETEKDEEKQKASEIPEKPQVLKDFSVFLSFPKKEIAENWLKSRGVDQKFEGTARNITIRMEGIDYGTGD